jgi:CheY-like chemotaxis protein
MKILLIDDDKDDQALFCEAINEISTDIDCGIADNGLQGLELLQKSKALPDVIFLDVNMPIMDGREMIRTIRATPRLSFLSVVIYSTSNSQQEILWFQKYSARYMVKPNSFELLVEYLREELSEKIMVEQNQLVIRKAC